MSTILLTGSPPYFITNRLAIGDIQSRYMAGWTGIVTCCSEEQMETAGFNPKLPRSAGAVLKIPFPDGVVPADMADMLQSARLFIGSFMHQGGYVLVHCGGGISRSPFVVMDYLMDTLGMTTSEAKTFIRRAHPGASPAGVFLDYLEKAHRVAERAAAGPRCGLPE